MVGLKINKHHSYDLKFHFEYNVIKVCYYLLQRMQPIFTEQTADFNQCFKDHHNKHGKMENQKDECFKNIYYYIP